VANHDYFIAHRAFFFDLSVWDDEAPVDAPNQPLGGDKTELVAIFEAAYYLTQGVKMIHVGGFTPWWYKVRTKTKTRGTLLVQTCGARLV
jgi:hypothetical protein